MRRLRMTIELEYDDDLMHGSDPEVIWWFYNMLYTTELLLHSQELGDTIGTAQVIHIDKV